MSRGMRFDKIIVVDVEATCDEPQPKDFVQEIIEIGIVRVDIPSLTIEKSESVLVKPAGPISAFCTKLTTLTENDLVGRPDFKGACHYIKNKFGTSKYPWMSWGDFDRKLFKKQSARENVGYPFSETHTNMRVLFTQWMDLNSRPGMDKALQIIGLPLVGTHHRGVDDALNISRIYIEYMRALRAWRES